uniref:Uncharacterized protein n=1 Tax=Arundo donax TaxID=35708 RepID=A0A0A9A4Q6_ARUDO
MPIRATFMPKVVALSNWQNRCIPGAKGSPLQQATSHSKAPLQS